MHHAASGIRYSVAIMHTTRAGAVPKACPKYLALARQFERQLRAGVLRVGDRLPSVRQLRADHQVSAATAVGCYLWLERQGYVHARPKSGYYVSRTPPPDPAPVPRTPELQGPVAVQVTALGGRKEVSGTLIPLGPATVAAPLLPTAALNRSVRVALSAFNETAVHFEDPRGNLHLRRQLARLIFRQGASCSPDEVIVTAGSTEALNLSLRAVTKPGDVVAVESPGCYEMLEALEANHLHAVEIPRAPEGGIDLDLLTRAALHHRIAALMIEVTCHNPLGDCVADARKIEIVRWAAAHNVPIIEGDVFGDLLFSGARPRSLKSYDPTGIVLHCGSLAHHVAPGFNLGWSHAGRWRDEILRLKSITSVAMAGLPQLAIADFLESGGFEKHLKRLRTTLRDLVSEARREVLRTFPQGTRVNWPEGGYVLWIQLPDGIDGVQVRQRALAKGIEILPGVVFSPNQLYRDCIRIACGHPFAVLKPAIHAIAGIVRDLS